MSVTIHVLLSGHDVQSAAPHATIDLAQVENGEVPSVGQVVEVSAEAATWGEAFAGEVWRRSESLLEDGSRVFELMLRPVERPRVRLVWSKPSDVD